MRAGCAQYYENELRRKDAMISFLMQQLEAARSGKQVSGTQACWFPGWLSFSLP